MPCYRPLRGYRSPFPNSNGKFGFVFDKTGAAVIPCGKCIGCQLDRSRAWALRCVHEASLYERNCFVTLTFDDVHIPRFGALEKRTLQLFFKRLRKRFGSKIRYFACGEYGTDFGRPHFHACIFNHNFTDRVLWSNRNNNKLFTSVDLTDLWPFGFSSVGDLTFGSAAYVARYVVKKVYGSHTHYTRLVPETGELVSVPPEFVLMSRRPGLAKGWFDLFKDDVYPSGFVVNQGQKYKPPRYYDQKLDLINPELYDEVKAKRYEASVKARPNCTPERLKVRELCANAKLSLFSKRELL